MNPEIFVPLTVFASLFGIFYVFLVTRNKERLALIEKGADASLFSFKRNKANSLRIGMFIAGIGLGLLLGNVISETTRVKEEIAYFSMAFICGGISLILFYLIERNIKVE
jgi:predicted MFS family arabinose efflux permease